MLKSISLSISIISANFNFSPYIAHGRRLEVLNSILSVGLRITDRQCVMFSALPHWDARIGYGQRSVHGQWSAINFFSKTRVVHGGEDNNLRPLFIGVGDLSGTISVYADILPPYIEQIIVFVPTIFDRSMGDERLFQGRRSDSR